MTSKTIAAVISIIFLAAPAAAETGNQSVIYTEWDFEYCEDIQSNVQGEECQDPEVLTVQPFLWTIYGLAAFFIGGYILSWWRRHWKGEIM